MSRTHDDDAPVEHDPTGVRALLAGLPDPGPMPPDLVARITAALEAEAAAPPLHAVAALPPEAGVPEHAATAASRLRGATAVRRPHRLNPRHFAVAAGVAAAVGLGGLAVQLTQGGLLTSFDTSAGSDSAGASGQEEKGTDGGGSPQFAPEAGSSEVVVVMSGRTYTAGGLATQARALGEEPTGEVRDLAAEAPSLGPIATPIGARTCASALGVPLTAGVLVDVAEVDGQPAAVLVVTDDRGREAWAVDRTCTTGTTGLIHGPVAVD